MAKLAEGFMLGNDLKKGGEAYFWHGTTSEHLSKILTEGLKLDTPSNYRFEVGLGSSFGIYLTTGLAPYYAMASISRWHNPHNIDGLDGVLLKVQIKDVSRLIADEDLDFYNDVHDRISKWKDDPSMKNEALIIENNYQKYPGTNYDFPKISKWPAKLRYDSLCSKSLKKLGSVRIIDDISPEAIIEVYTFKGRLFTGCTEFAAISLPTEKILTPKEFVAVKNQEMIYLNMTYNKKKPGTSKDVYRFIKSVNAQRLTEEDIEKLKNHYKRMKEAELKKLMLKAKALLNWKPLEYDNMNVSSKHMGSR